MQSTGRVLRVLYFETHAESLDNEQGLASGQFDADLSPRGREQAKELGARYAGRELEKVYTSDLARAWSTARIAFARRGISIASDPRLRECHYGAWTRWPAAHIESARTQFVDRAYPNGESYREVARRVEEFLSGLEPRGDHLIIGHRATWYALEHLLGGRELQEVVGGGWRWQPGWTYRFKR